MILEDTMVLLSLTFILIVWEIMGNLYMNEVVVVYKLTKKYNVDDVSIITLTLFLFKA